MLHYLQELLQALDVVSLMDAVLRTAAVLLCLTVHETCNGLAAYAPVSSTHLTQPTNYSL